MIKRPRYEVVEVFEWYLRPGEAPWSGHQRTVVDRILACRTARLGGHVGKCDDCGHREISYNSCRNRHCPKCQGGAQAAWLEARQADVLPVPYAHVVFTLPQQLAPLALQNPSLIYDLLMRSAAETLQEIASSPRHLGGRIGFFVVLHTWGQTLVHHPHVHCVVPAGGLAPDGTWRACRPGFFLPVRVLSRLFRGKFLAGLRRAFRQGRLEFHGALDPLHDRRVFERLIRDTRRTEWVVYAKPPFEDPEHVLAYLARYTHRIAISNHRILNVDDDSVTFRYKDYRSGRPRSLQLTLGEFTRRFLLHVLPKRFVRIRHYGFLANAARARMLPQCRRAIHDRLDLPDTPLPQAHHGSAEDLLLIDALLPKHVRLCPNCGSRALRRVEILARPPPRRVRRDAA